MAIQGVQAIINGVTTALDYNSTTGSWEKKITAPTKSSYNINTGHYYPITLKATDTAGNTITKNDTDASWGKNLRLTVKESVVPVIVATAPTEGQILMNSKPTVNWKITDNDSGVNSNSIAITIDNGSKTTSGITKTAITGGYQCSYTIGTALTDGSHTVKLDGQDNDGNNAIQRTVNFKVDTIPPTLSVTSPVNNLTTNNPSVVVAGVTNDVVSNPCIITILLNGTSVGAVTVNADGSFSKPITLIESTNQITITSTDKAGRASSITRVAILDTIPPSITVVSVPSKVNTSEVFTIAVKVID